MELKTKYGEVKIFAKTIEEKALSQIIDFANSPLGENSHIRIMSDCHAGAGCVIGTTMKITDKICPNLVGVDIGCLDKDTEFLTPNGWKKMNNYIMGEKVLQYNPDKDTANFIQPLAYIDKECEEFYHFKNNKGLDQMLSAEHKILVWKGGRKRGYNLQNFTPVEIAQLGDKLNKGYYGVKTSFVITGNSGVNLTDDEIRLDVMISADGSIKYQRENEHQIYLHFKKERKIKRAKELLRLCHIDCKETKGKDGSIYIYFFVSKHFNKSLSKYWSATSEQLKILTEECLLWDGHKGYRSYFSSTDKENIDIIQFAFTATNIRAGIGIITSTHENWNDNYTVTPTKNNIIGITNDICKVKSVDGRKYCFTMPSGYFVARRNGKIFITGNCGVDLVKTNIDFSERLEELDNIIRAYIPCGMNGHDNVIPYDFSQLKCWCGLTKETKELSQRSLGTLGGGNHFIEAYDNGYIAIHSGSRNIGYKVAEYYQKLAEKEIGKYNHKILMEQLKLVEPADRENWLKNNQICVNKDLCYLQESSMADYLHDIKIIQQFAVDNRKQMLNTIANKMGGKIISQVSSTHNYIDIDNMILRKGAISAQKDEMLVIPLNMRDGLLICKGKGNEDWNYSAPHGAGRLYSRSKAKETFTVEQFQKAMEGIYSSCINSSTLDEAPFAYKDYQEIMECIEPTVEILKRIIPIYNFKSDN